MEEGEKMNGKNSQLIQLRHTVFPSMNTQFNNICAVKQVIEVMSDGKSRRWKGIISTLMLN